MVTLVTTGMVPAVRKTPVNKIIGAVIGLAIGWVVEQVAADVLQQAGVPAKTARAAGAVVGAIVA